MSFKCGIVGLPNVGKSTLFNALTNSSKAQAANFPFCTIEPNVGIVPVPDIRLKNLANISNSKKIINTTISFVDIAGLVKGAPNKANAIALVDFLLSPESQEHFTNNTFEFPMIGGVSPSPLVVNNLGLDFKQDLVTKVSSYGKNQADALEVMTAAGWK